MQDSEKITLIREAMPAVTNSVFLNNGSAGPLSTFTFEALHQESTLELSEGRADFKGFKLLRKSKNVVREAIAKIVNSKPEEIALSHHTTEGMNIVTHGLNWQPGDEIVTTSLEHEGGLRPLIVARQRHGAVIKVVDIAADDANEEIVAKLEAAITPRTRLLVFSHVTWNTCQQLPLSDIVSMGHRHNVPSLVDGAQSAGAIPLDLPASRVDFYAMPGQKWLCGPEGIGALYVRPDRLDLLSPTFVGFNSFGNTTSGDLDGDLLPAQGSLRYEVGTVYRPGIKAMAKNLNWLQETIGWDWIYSRIAHLASYTYDSLKSLAGVSIITPPCPQAGMITFTLDGCDLGQTMAKMGEENIIIRSIKPYNGLRVSTGFYNTEEDIDRLVSVLKNLLNSD